MIRWKDSRYDPHNYFGLAIAVWTAVSVPIPPGGAAEEDGYNLIKRPDMDFGSNWEHPLPSKSIWCSGQLGFVLAVNYPSAVTEFLASLPLRHPALLLGVKRARLSVNVKIAAPHAGSLLAAQYSLDAGSKWAYLDGASGPQVLVDTPTGLKVGGWVDLETDAKDDVWIRLVELAGNDAGVAAEFGDIILEFSTR